MANFLNTDISQGSVVTQWWDS